MKKRFSGDPFSLLTFHRVLIGTAIVACFLFGVRELLKNLSEDPTAALIRTAVAWILTIALILYFRHIKNIRIKEK